MAAFHHDALITLVAKVYPNTTECLTYSVSPENIKAALLLGKSFFFAAGLIFVPIVFNGSETLLRIPTSV